jgi:hypothetical protein
LSGTPVDDDIEVSCLACGHRWMRGGPVCRTCGGEENVSRLQLMTRQPRGNQLAVVGHRAVSLCPRCDVGALQGGDGRTIPEGYVSKFLFGAADRPVVAPSPPRPPAADADTPPAVPPRAPAQSPGSTRQPEPPRRPRTAAAPTVRQAIDAFMAATPDADPLTMLMLGRHLGPATRLRELDAPASVATLEQWFEASWCSQPAERRATAAAALRAAVDHWQGQGWLSEDLAAFLR